MTDSTCSARTTRPSSLRRRFSRRTFIDQGRRRISGRFSASLARLKIVYDLPSTSSVVFVPKVPSMMGGSRTKRRAGREPVSCSGGGNEAQPFARDRDLNAHAPPDPQPVVFEAVAE